MTLTFSFRFQEAARIQCRGPMSTAMAVADYVRQIHIDSMKVNKVDLVIMSHGNLVDFFRFYTDLVGLEGKKIVDNFILMFYICR